MRKLLAADFRRLFCSPLYLGGIALMMLVSAGFVWMQCISVNEVGLERVLLLFMSVYGAMAAIFVSLFLGEEYADGTLRNKLIIGSRRTQIYLSQTVAAAFGCASMYLAAFVTALCLGAPLFELRVSVAHEALTVCIGLFVGMYYAALYTLVTTLLGSRSAAVAANMMLSVLLLIAAVSISEMLIGSSAASDGGWRIVLESFPTGQAVLVNEASIDAPVRMILFNALGAALCTALGAKLFLHADVR